jgi:hypothetical protein
MEVRSTDKENGFESDMIDLVRRLMEDMFIPLFLDEQACQKIGFTHISRLIGEMPGWYLWTRDDRGAYLLELTSLKIGEPISMTNQSPFLAADLVLRYYSTPEEPSFKEFAPIEQEVRRSPWFDRTGTPLFEKQDEIHESLFIVGHICVAFDRELSFAKMKVSSRDRLVELCVDGVGLDSDSDRPVASQMENTRIRNVPGWNLSLGFFDKLLLGFCYVHKSHPFRLRLIKSPALIYCVSKTGQYKEVRTSEIEGRILEVGIALQPANMSAITPESLWESFSLSTDGDVMIVDSFENASEEKHPWINPDWWTAQSWSFPPGQEIKHCCFRDH